VLACNQPDPSVKLGFDLSILNENGLYGGPGAERALHYEFCMPPGKNAKEEVVSIDPSVTFSRTRGRIGCRPDQLLAEGNTNQPNHKEVLVSLAELRYIERIEQSFFE
jgi:hypothetical protein